MPDQAPAGAAPIAQLLPMVIFPLAIFYILVWRPHTKARKEQEQMLKNLKKNDTVVTSGGLFGTIVNVKAESITLRVDDNVRVEVESSAIARVVKPKGQGTAGATTEKRT